MALLFEQVGQPQPSTSGRHMRFTQSLGSKLELVRSSCDDPQLATTTSEYSKVHVVAAGAGASNS